MRKEYYMGLCAFFKLHPEYSRNPIWVSGESYGGKYIPNVAWEIHERAELNLMGVIIGNGMFLPRLQYLTIPDYAYNQGIIDRHAYRLAKEKMDDCVLMIDQGRNAEAKVFCEATVDWIYNSNETGGGQFYYDLGMADGKFFNDLTTEMGNWLNSNASRAALHVGDHTWVQADEVGPVADALIKDFVTPQSLTVLANLLETDRYHIVSYNGVRDGSLCNHVGNGQALDAMQWSGQLRFREAANAQFLVDGELAGYVRRFGRLSYYTLLRTGHLVPTVVPKVALSMIDSIVQGSQVERVIV
jgi:carboxypeptidase C (cathepsin A)